MRSKLDNIIRAMIYYLNIYFVYKRWYIYMNIIRGRSWLTEISQKFSASLLKYK